MYPKWPNQFSPNHLNIYIEWKNEVKWGNLAFEAVAAGSRILPGAANVSLIQTPPTWWRRRWGGGRTRVSSRCRRPREPSSSSGRGEQNPIHDKGPVLVNLDRRHGVMSGGIIIRRPGNVIQRRQRERWRTAPVTEVPEERRQWWPWRRQ